MGRHFLPQKEEDPNYEWNSAQQFLIRQTQINLLSWSPQSPQLITAEHEEVK